jgi:hypothetical protein
LLCPSSKFLLFASLRDSEAVIMTSSQLLPGQSGLPVPNPTKSHWHKEPSEKLLGHRTTPELPHSADVVIVGSGITGAIAAHTLKERRPELDVVMLEAREACWGATGRVCAHICFLYSSQRLAVGSFSKNSQSSEREQGQDPGVVLP